MSHDSKEKTGTYFRCSHAILIVVVLVIGIGVGWVLPHPSVPRNTLLVREKDDRYEFIRPLLSCNISENKQFDKYKPLEQKIVSMLGESVPNGNVSVYYRDLNLGRWFGINEGTLYSPASLFKVPLMIAYFKLAETEPTALEERIVYTEKDGDANSLEYYQPKKKLTLGRSYTVLELIENMIENSDNNAAYLLAERLDQNSLSDVLTDIGLAPRSASTTATTDFISAKSYSYLFRLLYNSTYLRRDLSEKALQFLVSADFSQGIVGGVPQGIKTAQKFGERTNLTANLKLQSRELHDCGIVYYPDHPYLLCVMTRGKDFDVLARTIRDVSSLIYSEVDKEYHAGK